VIAVAGGTGRLGTLLVGRLTGRGLAVRVLTRDPGRASHLEGELVEVVQADVRDPRSLEAALAGVGTVVSAIHGFAGPRGISPGSVDRHGNANLIAAAAHAGAGVVLVSVVGAAADHPMELFRAKYDAEQNLRAGGVPWTIVRATAFMESWASILGDPLRAKGKILVFGRGDSPINFVSVGDVAAVVERAVVDPALVGRTLEVGGPENLTLNQLAAALQRVTGTRGNVRRIPRPALRVMGRVVPMVNPTLARQARAAVVMDTRDMTFDAAPARATFPDLPVTDLMTALNKEIPAVAR
jgi:NADH dehydrogenase